MKKKVEKEDVNNECTECKIEKINISFQNEDLNKLVEKLNEVIEKI